MPERVRDEVETFQPRISIAESATRVGGGPGRKTEFALVALHFRLPARIVG